ncbi:protein phosphatase 2C 29 [Tanacetum coccineum]
MEWEHLKHLWQQCPVDEFPTHFAYVTGHIEEVVAHSKKIMDSEKQEEAAYTNKENNGEVAEEKEPENEGDTLETELLLLIHSFMVKSLMGEGTATTAMVAPRSIKAGINLRITAVAAAFASATTLILDSDSIIVAYLHTCDGPSCWKTKASFHSGLTGKLHHPASSRSVMNLLLQLKALFRHNIIEKKDNVVMNCRKKKYGPVDHELVLKAMSKALEVTNLAYLDLTDKVMYQYPKLALMGSCLLAVLMRDEDVYVLNLGDSRGVVAQLDENKEAGSSQTGDSGTAIEVVANESTDAMHNVKFLIKM